MSAMAQAAPDLTQIAQTAQNVANDTTAAALNAFNTTDGWTVGPDGEFDGDPEEARFAVLIFYCILVSISTEVCRGYMPTAHRSYIYVVNRQS